MLAVKSTEDRKVKRKARFVKGGHRDKMKNFLVHDSSTLEINSVRLSLALSRVVDYDVRMADIT